MKHLLTTFIFLLPLVSTYAQDTTRISSIYHPFTYSATVTDIYDGDTFTLSFNLGFGLQ